MKIEMCDMERRKQGLTCMEARQWDMVAYLHGIGYEPSRIKNADYWYLSPLKNERTPSFKVNRRLNQWFDFALGKGGNLIDFGILYFGCGVAELLQKFAGSFSFRQPVANLSGILAESKITVLKDYEVTSYFPMRYLKKRRIDHDITAKFCWDVQYKTGGKIYYAIGLRNNSAGQNCSAYAKSLDNRYLDLSQLYKGYKDINQWLVKIGHLDIYTGLYPHFLKYNKSWDSG